MSEKELLYIDDMLGHIVNMQDFICANSSIIEDEKFLNAIKELESLNKEVYKKFYKLIEE